jgi:NADH-quinone oxidoreductase subunit J
LAIVDGIMALFIVALGACGTYLLLPERRGIARPRKLTRFAACAAGLGLLLFLSLWRPPGPFLGGLFFYLFALTAIAGGIMTITSTNPIHSALWFASVVLSTAGLFLFASAPFLAAGTVIVYAGAVVVTFLFVIMLAQLEGRAAYDRAARSPGLSTITCFLIFWCLIYVLSVIRTPTLVLPAHSVAQPLAVSALPRPRDVVERLRLDPKNPVALVFDHSLRPTARLTGPTGQEKPNTAGLGESLYTDHLITAGLASVLLFVALIGAIAITNPRRSEANQPGRSSRIPAT